VSGDAGLSWQSLCHSVAHCILHSVLYRLYSVLYIPYLPAHQTGTLTVKEQSHVKVAVGANFYQRGQDKPVYKSKNGIIPTCPTLAQFCTTYYSDVELEPVWHAGDSYLNFMGNEFGHPEWIDFPRGDSYDNSTGAFVPGKPDTPLPERPDLALRSVTSPFLSARHYVTPLFRVKGGHLHPPCDKMSCKQLPAMKLGAT